MNLMERNAFCIEQFFFRVNVYSTYIDVDNSCFNLFTPSENNMV